MDVELTAQAEELLMQMAEYKAEIKNAEERRDALIELYNKKIGTANKHFEDETKSARCEIAMIVEQLRRIAPAILPKNRKSIELPSGKLAFSKHGPIFFFDDPLNAVDGGNERLIHFVKHNAYDYLKVKVEERVDWKGFKGKLQILDGGDVCYCETGEIIDGLKAQILPDKFEVTTS